MGRKREAEGNGEMVEGTCVWARGGWEIIGLVDAEGGGKTYMSESEVGHKWAVGGQV